MGLIRKGAPLEIVNLVGGECRQRAEIAMDLILRIRRCL
jgi:hypothetical protein